MIVPRPSSGRVYETTRRVRVADADDRGRLRLDAVARFVQDVGNEDIADAGLDPTEPWVVRRTQVAVEGWPRIGERLAVATWCGGTGGRWAERRVSLTGRSGTVDVASLLVHLDRAGRPARLPAWFAATYAAAAQGRTVTSRLSLPPPPADGPTRPWPLRVSDLDVMGHVNNAIPWAALEDEWRRRGVLPTRATVEWPGTLEANDEVTLAGAPGGAWLVVDGAVRVAAGFSS